MSPWPAPRRGLAPSPRRPSRGRTGSSPGERGAPSAPDFQQGGRRRRCRSRPTHQRPERYEQPPRTIIQYDHKTQKPLGCHAPLQGVTPQNRDRQAAPHPVRSRAPELDTTFPVPPGKRDNFVAATPTLPGHQRPSPQAPHATCPLNSTPHHTIPVGSRQWYGVCLHQIQIGFRPATQGAAQ